jgi:hypothetical protein
MDARQTHTIKHTRNTWDEDVTKTTTDGAKDTIYLFIDYTLNRVLLTQPPGCQLKASCFLTFAATKSKKYQLISLNDWALLK